jgi:nitrogen fixation NifU-like protein|tara:strand:- start:260 stop:730 length:471 start_codon:yes stop_codon:yes gene_type:complete
LNNLSIYQEKILSLAAKNKNIVALKDFNRSFDMRNPMCGDEVKVRIKLVETKIIDISAVVRGCALCEASAGLVVELFKNKDIPDENFLEEFFSWLENAERNLSDQLPIEMKIFEPIREIKNRHKCITMPFEATYRSIDLKDKKTINQETQSVSQTK